MALDKRSFVLYTDFKELFDELSDENAGKLAKHIFSYVNDENPVCNNPIVNVAFIPIKLHLKRDLVKYEGKRQQYSEAGKASAEARRLLKEKYEQSLTDSTNVEKRLTNSTVSVNVNDNVNVIKNNTIDDRKLKFAQSLEPFLQKYGREMLSDFYKYWTEPNKSKTKFRQEMQKTWDTSRRLETWSKNNFGNSNNQETQIKGNDLNVLHM